MNFDLTRLFFNVADSVEGRSAGDNKKELLETISTGWSIIKQDNKDRFLPYIEKEEGREKFFTKIPIPGNIRGAIMGVALRALSNDRAICVSFGSLGYSKVLARIFKIVSIMKSLHCCYTEK